MKEKSAWLSALTVALISSTSFALEIEGVKVADGAALGGSGSFRFF